MAKFELRLPKMGESVAEATITSWLKDVGEAIEADEPLLEIATDKVDSEVPSEVEGVLLERFFEVDEVVQVGQVLAVLETATVDTTAAAIPDEEVVAVPEIQGDRAVAVATLTSQIEKIKQPLVPNGNETPPFYSPLVKNIAAKEGVSFEELQKIVGTGKNKRVTKNDILGYIKQRHSGGVSPVQQQSSSEVTAVPAPPTKIELPSTPVLSTGENEIIEMTRMGKLVAQHMTHSLQTAAHVQSFIEADVTAVLNWRNRIKDEFKNREGEHITFTPIFMEAIIKALKDFPMLNSMVSGTSIVKKKNINLGMAVALADGNLIVPVIKNADQYNLVGLVKVVNHLARSARNNQLKPDDVQDGTYTVTNVGSFGSIMGTPIINQPQVGILALGAIRKVPAVIETPDGDFIGIRHKMFLSHSYDHRIINGALGGQFVQRVAQYLEAWDVDREP